MKTTKRDLRTDAVSKTEAAFAAGRAYEQGKGQRLKLFARPMEYLAFWKGYRVAMAEAIEAANAARIQAEAAEQAAFEAGREYCRGRGQQPSKNESFRIHEKFSHGYWFEYHQTPYTCL